jgi:hypothetical protein
METRKKGERQKGENGENPMQQQASFGVPSSLLSVAYSESCFDHSLIVPASKPLLKQLVVCFLEALSPQFMLMLEILTLI